jgi:uncharacterized membrane protein YgcG
MKKILLALTFLLALCASLVLPAAAADEEDLSGWYVAINCVREGESYTCDGEYLLLNADGTGTVNFNDMDYNLNWTRDGETVAFEDTDGDQMEGLYADGVIVGSYLDYEYVWERNGADAPIADYAPEYWNVGLPNVFDQAEILSPDEEAALLRRTAEIADRYGCSVYVTTVDDYQAYSRSTSIENFAKELRACYRLGFGERQDTVLLCISMAEHEYGLMSHGPLGRSSVNSTNKETLQEEFMDEFGGDDWYGGITVYLDKCEELLSHAMTGQTVGTFYAVSCTREDKDYDVSCEYLVMNEDGTGLAATEFYVRSIRWERDGDVFTFVDNMGDSMTGTYADGRITGSWQTYDYVWEKSRANAPITYFAQERWNDGLPAVFDQADILSDEEETALAGRAEALSQRYGCSVYILTVDDFHKYSPSYSVEVFTEALRAGYQLGTGTQQDMVLLCLSMADRDYDLMANGPFGNAAFTDYGKKAMQEDFLDDFRDNDWYGGFSDYLDSCGDLLERAANGEPLDVGNDPATKTAGVFFSLLLGAIISLIVSLSMKRRMRSAVEKREAYSYIPENGVQITRRIDQYTHTTESRVYDPPQSRSSGGGGGTHTSGGGSSHSSGKF